MIGTTCVLLKNISDCTYRYVYTCTHIMHLPTNIEYTIE